MKVTTTIELTDQDCADIICTAIEGGINTWATVKYVTTVTLEDGPAYRTATILYDDPLNSNNRRSARITYDTVSEGITKLVNDDNLRDAYLAIIVAGIENIDANIADVIIQMGVFNEVVFC
jgi:hypothetical protein